MSGIAGEFGGSVGGSFESYYLEGSYLECATRTMLLLLRIVLVWRGVKSVWR